jgi:hypothetical protein
MSIAGRKWQFVISVVLLLFSNFAIAAETHLVFYAAPNGNDHWSGRFKVPSANHKDGPFATFTGALATLQHERAEGMLNGRVTVYFRQGTYSISKSIHLTPADSGTVSAPVTFSAYPGEIPTISGGKDITGWKKGAGGIWFARLPQSLQAWNFQQLFINGKRRTRAHLPASGFYRMAGPAPPEADAVSHASVDRGRTAFLYQRDDFRQWPDMQDAQVVVYHSWETSRLRIKSIDDVNHIVTFTGPAAWPFGTWEHDQRYTIDNIREGLTRPGEWYLDRKSGVVEYIPYPGEDPRKESVIAPVTQSLLQFEGHPKSGEQIEYIRVTGFHLEYADWSLEPEGHSDPQAVVSVPAVIMADGLAHCSLDHCEIAHIGSNAIWLGKGCKYNVIQQNLIHDMGVGGVKIGEASRPDDPSDSISYNRVNNNQIYDGGYVYPAGVGVWVAQSDHNVISHNDIHDLNYDGISIGWNWDDAPNDTTNNLIEYNRIYRVMRGKLSDGGGIYCLGASPGSVIRYNQIYDVFPYPNPPFAWGIYLDATTSGYTVAGNIVYDTLSGCLMAHNGAHENTVTNNIFADSATALIWPFIPNTHNSFTHNICFVKQGDLFLSWSVPALQSQFDNNLYYAVKGAAINFWGHTLSNWQSQSEDVHSVISNPEFINEAKFDFQLSPRSPAWKHGFQRIPYAEIGLYGDKKWVHSADKYHTLPGKLPPLPAKPKPGPIEDGFEQSPIGASPKLAAVIGEANGASIRVTDEIACKGNHSLKFTCVPGLAHSWEPYMQYSPNYTKGVAQLDFDIRLEQGAKAFMEWRDSKSPYLVGPSIQLRDDNLFVNGAAIMPISDGKWYHISITCPLGILANGHYDMVVTPIDSPAIRFMNLADGSPEFSSLEWLGFVCLSANNAVFYLDDVSLKLKSTNIEKSK